MTTATATGAPLIGSPYTQARTRMIQTQITDRIAALLRTAIGPGYPSAVGTTVLIGQVKGAEQQAPACFVIPETLNAEPKYAAHQITRAYRIAAFAKLSSHPAYSEHGLVDQIIRDVRAVLETRDAVPAIGLVALDATVQFQSAAPGYHEDGGQLVGAALQYQITFTQAAPPA